MSRPLITLLLVSALGVGCGPATAPRPVVMTHHGAVSYWPENSRTSLRESIARGYPGVEYDFTLTKDLVPVASHDPWLDETLCTTADGAPLTGRVLIQDLTLAELQAGYRCGGVPDPDHPDAEVVADTVMTFDEMLDLLATAPQTLVHVDIKCEPNLTPSAEDFAEQIMGRWQAREMTNPMYVESGLPDVLAAFRARGPVTTTLSKPYFPSGSSGTALTLGQEMLQQVGLDSVIGDAKRAGADGVCMPYQIVDPHLLDVARRSGLQVQIFTLNTKSLLEYFCRLPVEVIISDNPEEAPCLH